MRLIIAMILASALNSISVYTPLTMSIINEYHAIDKMRDQYATLILPINIIYLPCMDIVE